MDYDYYVQYYEEQAGNGLAHYSGRRFVPAEQEGDGLGDIFRAAKPFLINFAKSAGKKALSVGSNVLRDVLDGKSVTESLFGSGGEVSNHSPKPRAKKRPRSNANIFRQSNKKKARR